MRMAALPKSTSKEDMPSSQRKPGFPEEVFSSVDEEKIAPAPEEYRLSLRRLSPLSVRPYIEGGRSFSSINCFTSAESK